MRLIPLLACLSLAACGNAPTARQHRNTHRAEPAAPATPRYIPTDDGQTYGTLGKCFFGGWSNDTDPRGLNVRAGPSIDARIVGTLPPPKFDKDGDRLWQTGFAVLESRDGWFRIADAYNDADGEHPRQYPSGWIHGSKLDFELQSNVTFLRPDPRSPIVVSDWITGKDPENHRFTFHDPVQCKGHWVQLHATGHDGVERLAWARGICDAQETSCDGGGYAVHGDMMDNALLPRR